MPQKLRSASELLLPKTYEDVWYRGEAYIERGLVKVAKKDKTEIRALVQGTERYTVSLAFSGSGMTRKCTCPYAQGTGTRSPACKHMVAVAILWDDSRGIPRPTHEEIGTNTIAPPLVSRTDIERAFQNPTKTNLEILRLAASSSGAWPKPHERLPLMPAFSANPKEPLTLPEVRKAFRTLSRWTKLPGFDRYFCAGELVAAFCEVLRAMVSRCSATDPLLLGDMLLESQKFHFVISGELTDSSDGFHVFGEAHLDEFRDTIKKQPIPKEDRQILEQKLWNYEVHREDY